MRAPIWINFLVFPAAVALKRRTEMNGALLACCHDVTGGFCLWPFKARTSSNGGFFFIRADASADADSIRRFHHPLICIKFGKQKVDWVQIDWRIRSFRPEYSAVFFCWMNGASYFLKCRISQRRYFGRAENKSLTRHQVPPGGLERNQI